MPSATATAATSASCDICADSSQFSQREAAAKCTRLREHRSVRRRRRTLGELGVAGQNSRVRNGRGSNRRPMSHHGAGSGRRRCDRSTNRRFEKTTLFSTMNCKQGLRSGLFIGRVLSATPPEPMRQRPLALQRPRSPKLLQPSKYLCQYQLDRTLCTSATREVCSMLAKYTESEATTVVWTATGLGGVEVPGRLRARYCRQIHLTRHFSQAHCTRLIMCILTAWLKTSQG